jgi:hypothetical protein
LRKTVFPAVISAKLEDVSSRALALVRKREAAIARKEARE